MCVEAGSKHGGVCLVSARGRSWIDVLFALHTRIHAHALAYSPHQLRDTTGRQEMVQVESTERDKHHVQQMQTLHRRNADLLQRETELLRTLTELKTTIKVSQNVRQGI